MKFFLLFICITFLSKADAQSIKNDFKEPGEAKPRIPIQITQVDLVSDSSKPDGNGHKIYFNAVITSTGVGTVSYRWILRGNVGPVGNPPPPSIMTGTLTLSGTGTDHVYRTIGYGSHGLTTIQFETTAPVVLSSPTRSY